MWADPRTRSNQESVAAARNTKKTESSVGGNVRQTSMCAEEKRPWSRRDDIWSLGTSMAGLRGIEEGELFLPLPELNLKRRRFQKRFSTVVTGLGFWYHGLPELGIPNSVISDTTQFEQGCGFRAYRYTMPIKLEWVAQRHATLVVLDDMLLLHGMAGLRAIFNFGSGREGERFSSDLRHGRRSIAAVNRWWEEGRVEGLMKKLNR